VSHVAVRALTRLAPLDGLRGLAILTVLFHNCVDATYGATDPLARVLTRLAGPGWIGVQLFFALSGFLIVGELLDHRGAPNYLRAFYARRALRILPLYYSTLALVAVLSALLAMPGVAAYLRDDGWQLGLFVNNFSRPPPGGFAHFWSLAVEIQFYALAPWVVWRIRAPRLALACICVALGALVVRTTCAAAGADAWTLYTGTIFRLDALALGAAGACFVRIESVANLLRKHGTTGVVLAGVILLLGGAATHSYSYSGFACESYGYTLAALACALVVVCAGAARTNGGPQQPWIRWLSVPPLRLVGRYSFGIYLFHGLLNHLAGVPLARHFFRTPLSGEMILGYCAAIFTASFILAALSFEFFESRFLKLKPRFEPRPAPVDSAPTRASTGLTSTLAKT